MDLNPSLDPYFLSDLDTFPVAEVGDHVEAAARAASLEALENLTSALVDRALRALREGAQQDLLEESLAISQGLSGDAGDALKARHPEIYGAWAAFDDLLAEAGRRSDRAAVPGILKSAGTHGRKILEILAGRAEPVPRATILEKLGIGESHLSHLLHHLEEADLVHRFRAGKTVQVALGRVGREVAEREVLPKWVQYFRDLFGRLHRLEPGGEQVIAGELEAVAPSELAATRLVQAITFCLEQLSAQRQALLRQGEARGWAAAVLVKQSLQKSDSNFDLRGGITFGSGASRLRSVQP